MTTHGNECQGCGVRCSGRLCWRCGKRRSRKRFTLPHKKARGADGPRLVLRNGVWIHDRGESAEQQLRERMRRVEIYRRYVERHGCLDVAAALAEEYGQEAA